MPVALACLPSTTASTEMQSCTSSMATFIADGLVMETSFSYTPLQDGDIRLLRLLPGSGGMEVRCELVQLHRLVKLDSAAIEGM